MISKVVLSSNEILQLNSLSEVKVVEVTVQCTEYQHLTSQIFCENGAGLLSILLTNNNPPGFI